MIRSLIPIQRYKKLSIYIREKKMFPFLVVTREKRRLFYPTALALPSHLYFLYGYRICPLLRGVNWTVCMRVGRLLLLLVLLSGGFVFSCVCGLCRLLLENICCFWLLVASINSVLSKIGTFFTLCFCTRTDRFLVSTRTYGTYCTNFAMWSMW